MENVLSVAFGAMSGWSRPAFLGRRASAPARQWQCNTLASGGPDFFSLPHMEVSRRHSTVAQHQFLPREVLVASAMRTPIGTFCGTLANMPAPQLAGIAISAALRRANIDPEEVDSVVLGQALPSGCGQNVCRQAAMKAGLPAGVDCVSVNKACASGLRAVTMAAQTIALGLADVVVACGVESMSLAPYLMRHVRTGGYRYGHGLLEDVVLQDGLFDSVNGCHMGQVAEKTAQKMGITREMQDAFTVESYRRAADAWQSGAMDREVAVVRVRNTDVHDPMHSKVLPMTTDEEYSRFNVDTVASLPPVFDENGTITAASASSLNDGAAAVVLFSAERAKDMGIGSMARVVSFADHGVEPEDFSLAPNGAIRRALHGARMATVDFHEIHEAFAVVPLVNAHLLDLDPSRVNVNGGAVALGHPLGASGARILCTLLHALEQRDAVSGCASIANGGGGATAVIVERV